MANILKPKRSGVASAVPTTANLADGEIATNTADKIIYQRVGGAIVAIANFVNTALFAPLASPAFTGNPTAPTQASGNNSTRLATTAFVAAAVAAGGGSGGVEGFVVDGGGPATDHTGSVRIDFGGVT